MGKGRRERNGEERRVEEQRRGTVTLACEENRCRSAHVRLVFFLFFLSPLAFRRDCLHSLFEWQSVIPSVIVEMENDRRDLG